MDILNLVFVGLTYFLLQIFCMRYMRGAWSTAAILAAPMMAGMIGLSLFGMQIGIVGADLILFLAMPVGIAYLTGLMAARMVIGALTQVGKRSSKENADA